MEDQFENALRAAFETPTDRIPGKEDPFSIEAASKSMAKPTSSVPNTHMKSSKKRLREIDATKPASVVDAMKVEVLEPAVKHTKMVSPPPMKKPPLPPSSMSMSNINLPAKNDRLYNMCLQYADQFPDVCQLPSNFAKDLSSDELQLILDGFQRKVQSHNELELMRTGLVTGAMFLEQGSAFIPGQPVKLGGLANNFRLSIDRFDTCLKEIAIKYASVCALSPEQMLMLISFQICIHTHEMNTKTMNEISKE
jgi:hypothetical protein